MRAPGAVSGAFALESAIDELTYKLKIDPLEFRLINYAEKDPETGKPFSSKALRECFKQGAAKFGWERRKFEPRSMRDGQWLVGWGTATGIWGAMQLPASIKIVYRADGTASGCVRAREVRATRRAEARLRPRECAPLQPEHPA